MQQNPFRSDTFQKRALRKVFSRILKTFTEITNIPFHEILEIVKEDVKAYVPWITNCSPQCNLRYEKVLSPKLMPQFSKFHFESVIFQVHTAFRVFNMFCLAFSVYYKNSFLNNCIDVKKSKNETMPRDINRSFLCIVMWKKKTLTVTLLRLFWNYINYKIQRFFKFIF